MLRYSFIICLWSFTYSFCPKIKPSGSFQFPTSLLSVEKDQSSGTKRNANDDKLRVVIIGGGWAGFSAADSASSSPNTEVLLLDASPRGPGGLAGGWRTPILQRPVETGLHGFWRDYRNTFDAINKIGLDENDILTPYTPSILVSESGRVAVAPVLGEVQKSKAKTATNLPEPIRDIVNALPPPLDVALLSDFNNDSPLSLFDRCSAIGLLGVWADFEQEDPDSWQRYDGMSAEQLFLAVSGVTPTLYRELVTPLLHVLPMTPGYDCSAAAALSCFHVFALASKGAFDVRWCRGSISDKIFNPWTKHLRSRENVDIKGSAKVASISQATDGKYEVVVNDGEQIIDCDAVILAVGATALKRIECPNIRQEIPVDRLRGVTCVAVRLFLHPHPQTTTTKDGKDTQLPPDIAKAMEESPVVVCGPRIIPELAETGFCIYDLQRMQDDFAVSTEKESGDPTSEAFAALEVDFFRADSFINRTDEEIIQLTLRAVAAALEVKNSLELTHVLDFSVVRARDAVSHFCVNSASWSPSVKIDKGMYMCGDWIDRTGHASWSTEKAVVTGRQAVAKLAADFGIQCETDVIPAPTDTPQLSSLRNAAKSMRRVAPEGSLPQAPWMLPQIATALRNRGLT